MAGVNCLFKDNHQQKHTWSELKLALADFFDLDLQHMFLHFWPERPVKVDMSWRGGLNLSWTTPACASVHCWTTPTSQFISDTVIARSFKLCMIIIFLGVYISIVGCPTGSPFVGDVTVYVLDINQPSLPTLFILFLCLFLSLWPFQLYFIP